MTQLAPTPTRTLTLAHPVTGNQAQARQVGYIYDRGRAVGLKLDFGDGAGKGYQAVYSLTYQEIEELRKAVEKESQP
jgi:hypothetical protein